MNAIPVTLAGVPKRVLVVDDNPMNATLARIMLLRAGYEVHVEESAPLALQYLDGHVVDVVLTDISMPVMSGKELCRELRLRLGDKCPRLVAHTAFALDHQRVAIMEAGFDAIVVKPSPREVLIGAVDPAPLDANAA
ncbi:MAG: response regulator [Betaproteobacteria bacterium]|nr:response regulator [Betaproteobacteria bacterium]